MGFCASLRTKALSEATKRSGVVLAGRHYVACRLYELHSAQWGGFDCRPESLTETPASPRRTFTAEVLFILQVAAVAN